jgi:hypothetical protein
MSSSAQSASTATTTAVGVSTSATIATSALKASSPTAMWSLFNQLQMLILLLLVNDSYVPTDVSEYIKQQGFAMLNFNFIPTTEIPYLNFPTDWMDYEQNNETLKQLGLKWRSTFNNLFSFMVTLIVIVVIHLTLAVSPTCRSKNEEQVSKCKKIWMRVKSKSLEYLLYVLYVRLLLESNQAFLLSGISEIDSFRIDSVASIVSLCFAIIIVIFSVFLALKAYHMLYKHWNNYDKDRKFLFMEYYADIRQNKWARIYTSVLLSRRLLFIIIILLFTFFHRNTIFGILLGIQVLYFIQLLIIRPFEEIENNLVELTNE